MLNPNARTYLPNMVNMLVVKTNGEQRRLVIPNPFFEPFLQSITTNLSEIGYQQSEVRTADTRDPLGGGGEVHCVTNSKRSEP
jgi:hypothetical protein